MTVISSGLNTNSRGCLVSCQGQIYYGNNFDPLKVWDGISATTNDAGITGPVAAITAPTSTAAGGLSNGDHLIRYRYKNSRTGYVSNPSPDFKYTVTGSNGTLNFTIGAAAVPIIRSTDAKVDQIVLEITPLASGNYYQVATAANSATTIQSSVTELTIIQQFNSEQAYGTSVALEQFSHEVPPLGTIAVPFRGRLWILGDEAYPLTGVTFTNNSAAVSGTGFNTRWAGRVITGTGDTVSYEILSVASSVAMTLSANYGGTTGAKAATVTSKTPNRGYYSRLFYPEEFYASTFARDFLANRSDQVVGAIGRKDGLYVFGRYSAERLIYNVDPSAAANAVLSPLQGRRGVFHNRVVVDVEGELYAWDRAGMWIVQEVPKHISKPIDRLLSDRVDYSQSTKFFAAYDPSTRIVLFFFVQSGDTQPKYAAAFEIDTGRWSLMSWFQGITSANIVPSTDGQVRLMLGDENGYSWFFGVSDSFDGVPPTSSAVVTVSGSPTTTVIPVTQTLPTVAPTLAGVVVYNPLTAETAICSSNTASQITVGTGFAAAPTVGQELYLGPIQVEYRTKWWTGAGQETLKDPLYLVVKLYPGTATGKIRFYFYSNFQTNPSTVTLFSGDTFPSGVSTPVSGQGYLEADLDGGDGSGLLSIPVPIEWSNAIQARMTSVRPDGALRLIDFAFSSSKHGVISSVGN